MLRSPFVLCTGLILAGLYLNGCTRQPRCGDPCSIPLLKVERLEDRTGLIGSGDTLTQRLSRNLSQSGQILVSGISDTSQTKLNGNGSLVTRFVLLGDVDRTQHFDTANPNAAPREVMQTHLRLATVKDRRTVWEGSTECFLADGGEEAIDRCLSSLARRMHTKLLDTIYTLQTVPTSGNKDTSSHGDTVQKNHGVAPQQP